MLISQPADIPAWIAFFTGLYALSAGVAEMRTPGGWQAMLADFERSRGLQFLTGLFCIFAGGAIYLACPWKTGDWLAIAINIMGGGMALEGAIILAAGDRFMEFGRKLMEKAGPFWAGLSGALGAALILLAFSRLDAVVPAANAQETASETKEAEMGVTGIGGVFFRSEDPKALAAWYAKHLGVGDSPYGAWETEAGPSVFSPFKADTDYFPADKQFMLNFRVKGLGALIAALKSGGIEVIQKEEWDMPGVGRFARIHDPEGNPVELWEPDESADS